MSRTTSDATTGRILDAALELLESSGPSLTMGQITERARTSKAALYRRWPSKPALLADAMRHALHRANPVPHVSDDPLEDLQATLHGVQRALAETPFGGALRAIIGAAQTWPELATALSEVERERRGVLMEPLLRMGIPPSEAELESDLLLGSLYLRVLVRRVPLADDHVERVCRRLYAGRAGHPHGR